MDCGGCVETWEALSEARAKDDSKRRSFLKALSGIVGLPAIGGIASGSRSRSRGRRKSSGNTNLPNFEIIKRGKTKQKFIEIVRKNTEYQQLVENLSNGKSSPRPNPGHTSLVKTWDRNDQPFYAITVPLLDTQTVEVEVTAKIQEGVVKVVYGTTLAYDGDRNLNKVKQHTVSSANTVSTASTSKNGGQIQTESAKVEELLSGGDLKSQSASSKTVTAQSSGDCEACKTLAGILLSVGCGVSWGTVCAMVTAPTAVGPMACPAAASAICAIMNDTDYLGSDLSAESICAKEDGPSEISGGLGFCDRS